METVYKQPVSVLVIVYTPALDVLLMERADFPDHWQSVTGSIEPGEPLLHAAVRELAEETGIDAAAHGGVRDWHMSNVYEIFPQWRHRYPPGTTENTEHVFGLEVPARVPVTLAPRASSARMAALARSGGALLFVVQSRRHRSAARADRHEESAMKFLLVALSGASIAFASLSDAQSPLPSPLPPQPVVTVTASASSQLANDRMTAFLRVEVDNPDAVAAGNEVNTRMGKALARAKAVRGVEAATTAYSSYQYSDRNQPLRWRVAQTLSLESSEFTALSALVSRIQSEDGLVLSGMSFSVSPTARRAAEDALTQQAIKAWQARAETAARGFGSSAWRAGYVTIQAGDVPRPVPMLRQAAGAQAAAAAPVATEGGTTDITVTVSGEAILEPARTR